MEKELQKLMPTEWVLVRNSDDEPWQIDLYRGCGGYHSKGDYKYDCIGGHWKQCVPYSGHELLLDKTDSIEKEWRPVDGDFVVFGGDINNPAVGIFKCFRYNCHSYMYQLDYIAMGLSKRNILKDRKSFNIMNLRPATEDEKEALISRLREYGRDWDAEEKRVGYHSFDMKKGDFVCSNDRWICIYESMYVFNDSILNFNLRTYCYLDKTSMSLNTNLTCDLFSQQSLRLANEDEKLLLLSKLHEIGKDWSTKKMKLINYK